MPLLLVWARWNESWSRSWVRRCPRSGNLSWKVSSSHHRKACRIACGSRLWMSCASDHGGNREVIPQERVLHRIPEPVVDVPVPQITAKIGDFVQPVPPECTHERIVEQISVVPQTIEKLGDFVQLVPSERIQERIVENISLVLQVTEKIGVAVQPVLSERVQERIVEQISVVPQTTEKNGQVVQPVPPWNKFLWCPRPRRSRLWVFLCLRSLRTACRLYYKSARKFVRRSRSWVSPCLRSWRPPWTSRSPHHRSAYKIVRRNRLWIPCASVHGADVEIMRNIPSERVQKCMQEQIADFPVPQNMEDYAGVIRAPPLERVQNQILESVVDVPVPHIKQGAVSTEKVFSVKVRHHCDNQAFPDNVGFIKGLDKHNMPPAPDHQGLSGPCGATGFMVR